MKIFGKEAPDAIIAQICKIQNELLFEKADDNSVKSLIENGVLFFTELDDKQNLICFCSVNPIVNDWEIYDIATVSEYQNRGFAKKIIAGILDFAKKNNARNLFLEVRASNEKAINLYSKFGFEKYTVRKNYYANNSENAICMIKKL